MCLDCDSVFFPYIRIIKSTAGVSFLKTIYNFPPLIDNTSCEKGKLKMWAPMKGVAGTSVRNLHKAYAHTHTLMYVYMHVCMYTYIRTNPCVMVAVSPGRLMALRTTSWTNLLWPQWGNVVIMWYRTVPQFESSYRL